MFRKANETKNIWSSKESCTVATVAYLPSLLLVGSREQVSGKLPCHLDMCLHKLNNWIAFPSSLESHQNSRQRFQYLQQKKTSKRCQGTQLCAVTLGRWPSLPNTAGKRGKSHVGQLLSLRCPYTSLGTLQGVGGKDVQLASNHCQSWKSQAWL